MMELLNYEANIKEEILDSSLDYNASHSTTTTILTDFKHAVNSEKEKKIIPKQLNNLALNTHKAGMKGKLFELGNLG